MANMDYCMWENTARDMQDSVDKIERFMDMQTPELIENAPSTYEIRALIDVLNAAREIVNIESDIEDIYEELYATTGKN
jgi:hypothetical protein